MEVKGNGGASGHACLAQDEKTLNTAGKRLVSRLGVTLPFLVQTSPSVSERTKAESRGMTLARDTFSVNFQERRICKTLSSVIAHPELSNASAAELAPLRERFCE